MQNKTDIVYLLKNKGYSDAAIAGIVGNIDVETGGSFKHNQKQYVGPGYGLFQFDFLKPHYNKWLQSNKLEDSPQAQIDFFHDTVYGNSQDIIGRGNAKKLRSALEKDDPTQIAKDVSNIWLKPGVPHLDKRKQAAADVFDSIKGTTPMEADPEAQMEQDWLERPQDFSVKPSPQYKSIEGLLKNNLLTNPLLSQGRGLL